MGNNYYPKISIVTPSYNQGQFLEECIDSILSQNYPNLEYIIMDGGSSDNSVEIIKKYEKYLTYWQSKKDNGQYDAVNEGFKKTTGEIMTWLNSDDKYHPNAFHKVAYIFNAFSHIDWLTGRPSIWDKNGNLVSIEDLRGGWSREKYLQKNYDKPYIQQETVFWRRSLWNKADGHLRTDLAFAADLELWVRFFRLAQLYPVETLIGGYRRYGNQKAQLFKDKYAAEAERVLNEEIVVYAKEKTKYLPPPPPVVRMDYAGFRSAADISDSVEVQEVDCWRRYADNLNSLLSDAQKEKKPDVIELLQNEIELVRHAPNIKGHEKPEKAVASKSLPKISVITPSFNQGQFIEETIKSVLNQNYPNLEYIIIDGGSTDNSVDIIKKYEKQLAYWVSEKDKGQTDAINKGFKKATGDILAWLNSDDFYYPGAFECIVQAYRKHPHAGLYIGNGNVTDKNGKVLHRYSNGVGFDVDALINGQCYILQPSVFINRKAFEKIGYLDESLHYEMDVDYWIRTGREFEAVVMDEILSAYRWYEDIKTHTGAFKRWIEAYSIRRRYTDKEITPGLLVEFFLTLKNDFVLKDLGIDFREAAAKLHDVTFAQNQKALNLKDNIPVGRGIYFTPDKSVKSLFSKELASSAVVHSTRSKPKVDIVLQATGTHAWGVGGGWANGAKKLGMLHRVFTPVAQWGAPEVSDDDGLWEYLANPQADIMLLLGFDWHSQMLHSSPRWQERWINSKIKKILYVQESILNNCRLFGNELMKGSLLSAAQCVDAIVYTDMIDEAFLQSAGKPVLWQPFGVDDTVFNNIKNFRDRINRAFFRGKTTPFYTDKTYDQRRELIRFLLEQKAIDLLEYKDKPVTAEEVAQDFNNYQIALNFPSLFSNHPTRVYEALACGCALIANLTGIQQVDALFQHGRHIMYYKDKDELLEAINMLSSHQSFAEQLSRDGHSYVLKNFTLDKHLLGIINWLNTEDTNISEQKKGSEEVHLRNIDRPEETKPVHCAAVDKKNKILIDGIMFFLQKDRPAGISRVWKSLLKELAKSPLADKIILLDRDYTAPYIPGIKRIPITGCDFKDFEDNALYLEDICREQDASLLISTYFTYPENSHCVLMLHDMIPEIRGLDLMQPEYRSKPKAIGKARAYFAVSQSTANDFQKLYPENTNKKIYLMQNAVDDSFRLHNSDEIALFQKKYTIQHPYFLLIGYRLLYKNALLFFKAFSLLPNKADYEILCAGGSGELEKIFMPYVKGSKCHVLFLDDEQLSTAYSGAAALVYPSQYEGFGLPILEAMKSGCPVITCRNSAIPEAAGEAALYVDEVDVAGMRDALVNIQQPHIRSELIRKGLENVKRFSWKETGKKLVTAIQEILEDIRDIPLNPSEPLDTPGRLMYAVSKCPGWKDLYPAMLNLEQTYVESRACNHSLIVKNESTVASMDSDMFELLHRSLPLIEEKNQFMYYYYGLALEKRNLLPEALEAYKTAIACWQTDYVWRPAYLAADVAYGLGNLELARQLLTNIVLAKYPAYAEAQNRLRIINDEMKPKTSTAAHHRAADEYVRFTPPGESKQRDVKKKKEIKVSAIVSTYNSERFIRGCLEDLVNQTLYSKGELEIIVVDSGSQQNEKAIVEEFQHDYDNIVYIRTQERETVYAAWNRGIKAASGKYITNANTDDRHRQDALEIMAQALDRDSDIGVVYADAIVTETENETFGQHTQVGAFYQPNYTREELTISCFIGPQPMWRKSLHDKYGYFDETFVISGDWEFWLRISEGVKFLHIPVFLGLYLLAPQSIEHLDKEKRIKEDINIYHKYVPKYLLTIEDIDKGLAIIQQKERGFPGALNYIKEILLKHKSVILARQPDHLKTILSKKEIFPSRDEIKTVRQKQRIQGLTSLIILTSDQFAYAKKCIKSIRKNTPELHEVIVVDNSLSDKTTSWLHKRAKEDPTLKIIKSNPPSPPFSKGGPGGFSSESNNNPKYAKACNQAIAESSGEYILLLHDDVVVTAGWLSGMLECLNSVPDAGIVGPMTVNVDSPQKVITTDYNSLEYLDQFAKGFREKNRYRRVPSRKIDSCCMLFRYELVEKVFEKAGLFDERFDSHDFAVEDFCLRVSLEGYKNLVAGDVFLHHYGQESFAGEKTYGAALRFKNKNLFITKWSNLDKTTQIKLFTLNALTAAEELSQKSQLDNALAAIVEGIKLNPDDRRLHFKLVEILIENKKFNEAMGILENMPANMRQDSIWLENIAICKEGLQLNEEAERYADEDLAVNSTSSKALNLKGMLAYKKGLRADAEKFFQKSMESDRSFVEPYSNLGALRWITGKKEEAFKLFEKAFILSPAIGDIVTNYYSAVVSLSRLKEAASIFKEAIALYPLNRRLKFILIDNLQKQGKYHEAMGEMEEAMIVFGIDDNTLATALELRDKVGPKEIQKIEGLRGQVVKDSSEKQKDPEDLKSIHSDPRILESSNLYEIATPPLAARNDKKGDTISLCMIVKNEENKIGHCLWKIKPAVDELIVVNTGSTDRTKDIAKAFGAKVFDFEWTDSFADARNFSLSKATGKWILVLDADEVIAVSDYEKLKALVSPPHPPLVKGGRGDFQAKPDAKRFAYSFVTRNYVVSMNKVQWTANDGTYITEEAGTGWFPGVPGEKVRLFPNERRIRFESPVHEQVEPSLLRAGIEIVKCDIPIHHYGEIYKEKANSKVESYY